MRRPAYGKVGRSGKKNGGSMDAANIDLADEIKSRSHAGAAEKLANLSGEDLARELMHLSPGFAQDVLDALPTDARERATSAAPADIARQWQRNALYDPGTVGRMTEPVVAAFPPDIKVGETRPLLRRPQKAPGGGHARGPFRAAPREAPQGREAAGARPPLPGLPG